jgi:type I restriction enzyme R subunit
VKAFIIPDIVLFVNGIPLCVVECKKGSETCANPMQEAFVQLQRYMRRRTETEASGAEGRRATAVPQQPAADSQLRLEADYGTITSGEEHFYAWKTLYPQDDAALAGMNAQQQPGDGHADPAQPAADFAHQLQCSWTPTVARA